MKSCHPHQESEGGVDEKRSSRLRGRKAALSRGIKGGASSRESSSGQVGDSYSRGLSSEADATAQEDLHSESSDDEECVTRQLMRLAGIS